jgi:hypothetical protein
MSRRPARRLSVALTGILLLAQLILAWHIPSHLHDHQHHAFDLSIAGQSIADESPQYNEPCALGINGHGIALPPATQTNCTRINLQLQSLYSQADYRSLHTISYQARGPPLHS